jgi:hypothetical protein
VTSGEKTQQESMTLGGAMGIRTPDLLNAIEALYQLSYDPKREPKEKLFLPKVRGER